MAQNPRSQIPGEVGRALRRLEDRVIELSKLIGAGGGGASSSDDVSNESGVTGATVTDALDQLESDMTALQSTKLDDWATPDDNTDLNANTSRHGLAPKGGGDTTKFFRGDWTQARPSETIAGFPHYIDGAVSIADKYSVVMSQSLELASGGTLTLGDDATLEFLGAERTVSVWMPDAPYTTPHASDSEGDSTSGWSIWDPAGGTITHTVSNSMHSVTQTSQASDKFGGIYKAIPTSNEWVMYVKMGIRVGMQRFFQGGIAMWDSNVIPSPTTAKFAGGAIIQGNGTDGNYTQQWIYTNYTTNSSTIRSTTPIGFRSGCYMRLRVNMTAAVGSLPAFDVDFSVNGIDWVIHSVTGSTAVGFTPTHCGLIVDNFNTGNTLSALYDFVRFQEGTGTATFTGTSLGNLVQVKL